MRSLQDALSEMEKIDFAGKGEAFVESNFLTPLLACLGYEAHKDYDVRRHGDDGTSFKLHYPPVEKGANKVKHYNPDYIPTIRKRVFWIVEAKSPREVSHPFEKRYLIQGFQYCIHPEIRAKYLVVTNGVNTSVYDAHDSVFLGRDMYAPILEFKSSEIAARWEEIYEFLSVERLRARIESDLKAVYDKLCLSSLDRDYPKRLLRLVGADADANSRAISKHVAGLYVAGMDQRREEWANALESYTADELFRFMDFPPHSRPTQAECYVSKSLSRGTQPDAILCRLVDDFESQSIFRKEQTFIGVCSLYQQLGDGEIKLAAEAFLNEHKDAELPLINRVECAFLRVFRKISVLNAYPVLRDLIARSMEAAPELVRYVDRPSALGISYGLELAAHNQAFDAISKLSQDELQAWLSDLLRLEGSIENDYQSARASQPQSEIQIGGFEHYGIDGRHYAFKNIMLNFKIGIREND